MGKTPEQAPSDKLFKKICRKMGTTMRDHSMIAEGDRLLVGLSGGKDSMILVQAHVEASGMGYKTDRAKLSEFCLSMDPSARSPMP